MRIEVGGTAEPLEGQLRTLPLGQVKNGHTMRRAVAAVATLPAFLLSGCLAENSLDMAVYFNNKTDETLYLIRRDQPQSGKHWVLKPGETTPVMLVTRDACKDLWVITRADGSVAKDPGKMCWHDTVSIP